MAELVQFARVTGQAIPSYRIYFLDAAGHIVRAKELSCLTDDEAVAEAQALLDGQAIELWDRARMIARFDALR